MQPLFRRRSQRRARKNAKNRINPIFGIMQDPIMDSISFRNLSQYSLLLTLQFLDIHSLTILGFCNRKLNNDSIIVAKNIWNHLVSTKLSRVDPPTQISYTKAVYEHFFANKNQEVLLMGGHSGHMTTNKVMKMIIKHDDESINFESSTSMLQAQRLDVALYNNGEVISISTGSPSFKGTLERLDTLTQKRKEPAEDLPESCQDITAVVLCNKLFIIGGFNTNPETHQCFPSNIVYELTEQIGQSGKLRWIAHQAKLNIGRYSAASIIYEGRIFVCGGFDENNDFQQSVESFDPSIGTWQLENNMNIGRANFSLFIFEDELYAIGGNYPTTIEKRNKKTLIWEFISNSELNRYKCDSILVGSKVFIFGGEYDERTFDFFDFQTMKWASLDPDCNYFDINMRRLPHDFIYSKPVLISHPGLIT